MIPLPLISGQRQRQRQRQGKGKGKGFRVRRLQWQVDPGHLRLTPTARRSCPSPWIESPWIECSGLRINPGAVLADFQSLAVVALMRRHEFDIAVPRFVGVPVHMIGKPQAVLLLAGEWLVRIIRPVLNGAQQCL